MSDTKKILFQSISSDKNLKGFTKSNDATQSQKINASKANDN